MVYNYKETCDSFDKNNAYSTQGHINLYEITLQPIVYTLPTIVVDDKEQIFETLNGWGIFYKDYGHEKEFGIEYMISQMGGYPHIWTKLEKAQQALADILQEHTWIQKLSPQQVESRIKELKKLGG